MKKVLLAVTGLLSLYICYSQSPVQWNYFAKKIADKTYEVHLSAAVSNSWHIYSQFTPEDGPLPTKITFTKNPLVNFKGNPKEIGKIISKYEEVFEIAVKYFEGSANFIQVVKLRTDVRTNVSGNIEYMACNDGQCMPPQTVKFSIALP